MSFPALIAVDRERARLRKAKKKAKAKRLGHKKSLSKLKKELWALLSRAVKDRDGNVCFSSGKAGLEGSGWHAGHLFSAGMHSLTRFHPRNIHSQSFHENVNLGGNGAVYAQKFIEKYGMEYFEAMARASSVSKKWTTPEIEMLIEKIKLGLDYYTYFYESEYGPELKKSLESGQFSGVE